MNLFVNFLKEASVENNNTNHLIGFVLSGFDSDKFLVKLRNTFNLFQNNLSDSKNDIKIDYVNLKNDKMYIELDFENGFRGVIDEIKKDIQTMSNDDAYVDGLISKLENEFFTFKSKNSLSVEFFYFVDDKYDKTITNVQISGSIRGKHLQNRLYKSESEFFAKLTSYGKLIELELERIMKQYEF